MGTFPYELLLLPAGWLGLILLAWISELLGASRDDDLLLSTDERVASDRARALYDQFSSHGFPDLKRREIWDRICWLWRYGRVLALQSGRLMGVFWLLLYGASCLGVALVCLFRPRSHSLRVLLGGCDFVSFSSVPRSLVGNIRRTLG